MEVNFMSLKKNGGDGSNFRPSVCNLELHFKPQTNSTHPTVSTAVDESSEKIHTRDGGINY